MEGEPTRLDDGMPGPVEATGPAAVELSRTPPVAAPKAPARPWGPWATVGWTALCVAMMIGVQTVVLIGFLVVNFGRGHMPAAEELTTSALLLSLATLVSTPLLVGAVVLLVVLRGCRPREYLALGWPGARPALIAFGGLAALLAAGDLTTYLLGRPIVPPVTVNVYKSGWLPLLLVTLLVAAPAGEEVLFRGFFFRGVAEGWGPGVAIVGSSLGWAALHVQYDLYGVGIIVLSGLYLGAVRWRTESLPLCVLLHSVSNAVATAEIAIKVHWFS